MLHSAQTNIVTHLLDLSSQTGLRWWFGRIALCLFSQGYLITISYRHSSTLNSIYC